MKAAEEGQNSKSSYVTSVQEAKAFIMPMRGLNIDGVPEAITKMKKFTEDLLFLEAQKANFDLAEELKENFDYYILQENFIQKFVVLDGFDSALHYKRVLFCFRFAENMAKLFKIFHEINPVRLNNRIILKSSSKEKLKKDISEMGNYLKCFQYIEIEYEDLKETLLQKFYPNYTKVNNFFDEMKDLFNLHINKHRQNQAKNPHN